MRQLRFGSYSTAATLAGTPSLVRRKSTRRYWRLWPPPLCRAVLRPWLFRPPVALFGARRDFSGVVLVISAKSETVWNRRPGLVGLRLRSAIVPYPSNRSIDSPAARVTRARLESGFLLIWPVRRLRVPLPL